MSYAVIMEEKGVKETGSSTLFRLHTAKVHTHIELEKSGKTANFVRLADSVHTRPMV